MDKGKISDLYQKAHREWHQEYYSSVVDPTIKSVSVSRHFDYELFAELIVQECIHAVEGTNDRYRRDYFAAKIKEHFGVEQ